MKLIVFGILLFIAEMAASRQSKTMCINIYKHCLEEMGYSRQESVYPETKQDCPCPLDLEEGVNYTAIDMEMQRMLDEKYDLLQKKMEEYENILDEKRGLTTDYVLPQSCNDVHKWQAKSWYGDGGLFDVFVNRTGDPIQVYCDLVTDHGGWTVFQRRMDGSVDFYRTWEEYASGFGDEAGEFWLGLETIHAMTKVGKYELRVDMKDWSGKTAYAHYGTFSVGDRDSKFQLTVGDYNGNAGNSLATHNHRRFTTKDADYDGYRKNCADVYLGGWWYNECHHVNFNGKYTKGNSKGGEGLVWKAWKGPSYSMKFTEMKFRKVG